MSPIDNYQKVLMMKINKEVRKKRIKDFNRNKVNKLRLQLSKRRKPKENSSIVIKKVAAMTTMARKYKLDLDNKIDQEN
jgi:hypothetical protein